MSILAEVLSNAEKFEIDEINNKVPDLELSIGNTKRDVLNYIENVYVKYSTRPKQNRTLLKKAHEVQEEIKTLKKNAENATKKDLFQSKRELEKCTTSLENIDVSLKIVFNLFRINENLLKFDDLLQSKSYLNCMEIICKLEESINNTPDDEWFEILDELKFTIYTKKNRLVLTLKNLFTDNIILLENVEPSCVTLKVKQEDSDLKEALLALYFENNVVTPLHSFAKSLWTNVLIPIVDYTVDIKISKDERFYILKVSTVDTLLRSNYTTVFSNLKLVLEFLDTYLNIKLSKEMTTLGYIGLDIRDNLSELIIKHCLQDTIPSNAEELQKYKVVIEDTKNLEKILVECNIFAEDTASIFDYANNVNILFINKKCQEHLIASQEIMKKDLHDMIEVGEPYNTDNPLASKGEKFQQCSVSRSVIELLQYSEKILQQATTASSVCAGRLFCTVQNIFRKYGLFVPEYHKKLLQTIPQQVALFHNNCLYICHTLTEWYRIYSPKLSPLLNTDNCGYGDEIFQLQKIASEIFSSYVEGQIKQINEIMEGSKLKGSSSFSSMDPVTEKCIRQCLRQQELLKTVWHKVLSYQVYNKTIGVILDALCNNIINPVVEFEDISSDVAEQLVETLKVVLTRGPKLFSDPKEISLYVPTWYKLVELNFVLNASLVDINDRWANGKGPLALLFKPAELRQLIRALFQNTDRRSAVLANIQE